MPHGISEERIAEIRALADYPLDILGINEAREALRSLLAAYDAATKWWPMADMSFADRGTRTFWLGKEMFAEPAYFSSSRGDWRNLYSDNPLSFEPTHYQLLKISSTPPTQQGT